MLIDYNIEPLLIETRPDDRQIQIATMLKTWKRKSQGHKRNAIPIIHILIGSQLCNMQYIILRTITYNTSLRTHDNIVCGVAPQTTSMRLKSCFFCIVNEWFCKSAHSFPALHFSITALLLEFSFRLNLCIDLINLCVQILAESHVVDIVSFTVQHTQCSDGLWRDGDHE